MSLFLLIGKHSPENCSMFNEKARWIAHFSKLDEILKKHGCKIIGGWSVPTEHLSVAVFEAPSFEAFQKCGMEPEVMALSAIETYEVKPALNMEEMGKMLKQAK